MGEAAREEARRAVQFEPKLAPAWRHLGWVLQHDDLGRRFGPGFDRAGALAAYRKAKELDPKEEDVRADLAILLEHDAAGIRYSPRSDLAAAIDEYKALKKDLNAAAMDDNLLVALIRAGRFPEAKEMAAKNKGSQTASVMSLVATAATDGADAAVREGERAFGDDKARAAALQSAAQTLMLTRRYKESAVLMERAGRQSDNAAALLSLAEILRKVRRHEEIPAAADQPGAPARRLMVLIAAGELDVKQAAGLFSHDLAADFLKMGETQARVAFEAGFAPARKSLRSKDLPIDVAIDLALGALQETATGDDATGYRVSFSFPLETKAAGFVVYVVREGGEYRIAAVGTALSTLGDEALRRVQRGDLAGARKWLGWAREAETGDTGGAADPLPGSPFLALWPKGSESAAAEETRCAAYVLLAEEKEGAKALPALKTCREAATDPARRNAFDVALAFAQAAAGRWAEMEETGRRLLAAAPASDRAERLQAQALVELGRWDDVRALAERRLQRLADDPWAVGMLIGGALRAGDLGQAETRLRRTVKSGKATANDFNELAWLLLEQGRVDDETLDLGQHAATLSDYKHAAYLHTLASLYAEKGRTAEAYRILLQSIDARATETASPDDWYVFGRLAEQYGLPDVARKYYQRVPPPKSADGEPMSTHALAARRLAALGGGEKKPQSRATL